MLSITNDQGNANQNHTEISPHTCRNSYYQRDNDSYQNINGCYFKRLLSKEITRVGEDVEKREPSCSVGGGADWCSHCGKQYGVTSKKLKMELPFDPAIPLLGIYPKKSKTLI